MKIQFLGTAAAECWPGLFCTCDCCKEADARGGKNIRSRSSVLVNDKFKVDFPPDSYYHKIKFGKDLSLIEHLLITHSHRDHFYYDDLKSRTPPYAYIENDSGFTVYGNSTVRKFFEENDSLHYLDFKLIEPFRKISAGSMIIHPLLADHGGEEDAVFYVFESIEEGKRALIANDTGWPPEESLNYLCAGKLDFSSFDCTNGAQKGRTGHMGTDAVIELKNTLEEQGALTSSSICFATHFSHNGGLLHEDLEERFFASGIKVAYDGLTVEF